MTAIEKMFTEEVKAHNIERNDSFFDMVHFNKGLKFKSIEKTESLKTMYGDAMKWFVWFSFKPEDKDDNNRVQYEIITYGDGSMSIYFNGTTYEA